MGIKITTPTTPEALIYDSIIMTGLRMIQDPINDNSLPPKYVVTVKYKTYAVDNNNIRHFDTSEHKIKVSDYLQEAEGKEGLGDPTLMDSIVAIEKAVALLITEKGIGQVEVTL